MRTQAPSLSIKKAKARTGPHLSGWGPVLAFGNICLFLGAAASGSIRTNGNLTTPGFVCGNIQLLPTADDTIIDKVEKCISDIEPVTTMLDKGLSPETICRTVLPAFKLDVLDTSEPEYRCDCSRERVSRALISMGRDELEKLKEDEKTEVCCQFCDKKYVFTPADIDRLLEESKGKEDK